MSMFIDIDWTKQGNSEIYISNSEQVKKYGKIFSRGLWSFLGLGDEQTWYGTHTYKLDGKWDSIASEMGVTFQRNWTPSIQEYQYVEPWNLEKKRWQMY